MICNCGRPAVVQLDAWSGRCDRHRAVPLGGSTVDYDRALWRWWKTDDVKAVAACLAIALIGGLLHFGAGIEGAANMLAGGLAAAIVVGACLALAGGFRR